ncbi:MAG: LysM peptidoglycan-binding domain-containing protein, partial [Pseudolabrys sp.]
MSRPKVDSRQSTWPRVAILGLVGITAAGCADSARIQASSYANDRPSPPQSVSSLPAPATSARIEAQPLSPPATVAATPASYSPQSPTAYRSASQYSDVTGSNVPPAATHWAWNGGSAVTVGYGETIESIARRHGVPASAILQTNGIRDARQVRPGQRLVIPRNVTGGTQTAAVSKSTGGNIHSTTIASAAPVPQNIQPRTAPLEKATAPVKVASIGPVQTANV